MTDGSTTHDPQERGEPGAPSQRPRLVTGRVAGVGLVVGAVLVLALLVQFFDTYFAIGYTAVATPAQGTRYVVTAPLCLVLLVGGTVAAVAGGRKVLTGVGVVLTLFGLAAAVLLPVPSDRWQQERTYERQGGVTQCRSGGDSEGCLGG